MNYKLNKEYILTIIYSPQLLAYFMLSMTLLPITYHDARHLYTKTPSDSKVLKKSLKWYHILVFNSTDAILK